LIRLLKLKDDSGVKNWASYRIAIHALAKYINIDSVRDAFIFALRYLTPHQRGVIEALSVALDDQAVRNAFGNLISDRNILISYRNFAMNMSAGIGTVPPIRDALISLINQGPMGWTAEDESDYRDLVVQALHILRGGINDPTILNIVCRSALKGNQAIRKTAFQILAEHANNPAVRGRLARSLEGPEYRHWHVPTVKVLAQFLADLVLVMR
jgi:hypothetical protein